MFSPGYGLLFSVLAFFVPPDPSSPPSPPPPRSLCTLFCPFFVKILWSFDEEAVAVVDHRAFFCFLVFLDLEVLGFAIVFGGGCCYCCWVFVFWLVVVGESGIGIVVVVLAREMRIVEGLFWLGMSLL
jgi:hypothetical protein